MGVIDWTSPPNVISIIIFSTLSIPRKSTNLKKMNSVKRYMPAKNYKFEENYDAAEKKYK